MSDNNGNNGSNGSNGSNGNNGKTENAPQTPIEAMLQMMSGFWVSRGIYVVAKLLPNNRRRLFRIGSGGRRRLHDALDYPRLGRFEINPNFEKHPKRAAGKRQIGVSRSRRSR